MKISIALWTHNQLKDGTYPLKIKVFDIIDGKKKERYCPTNIYLNPNQWDDANKTVKNHHLATDYNIKIRKALNNLEIQKAKEEPINVKKATIGDSFIKYFHNYNETIVKIKHSAAHYEKLNAILNKLKDFSPNLTFKEIDRDFLKRYEMKLIDIGNGSTTRHDNFKRIKFIYGEAIKDKIITIDDSPFEQYKVSLVKTKKARLTYKEITEIENSYFKENSNQWHTRNYWLFSFYCAGIRFSDLCRLTKKNIVDGRLIYTMNKSAHTSNPQHRNIKLMPQALDILNIYLPYRHKFIFGIIDTLPKDKFEAKKLLNGKNSMANNNLKKIATAIKSDVELSFHSSRHSFADYCKHKKIDVHLIKDLLGHSKVSTTEIYMRDFYEEETDEAMDKLFGA
jgi:integrase